MFKYGSILIEETCTCISQYIFTRFLHVFVGAIYLESFGL